MIADGIIRLDSGWNLIGTVGDVASVDQLNGHPAYWCWDTVGKGPQPVLPPSIIELLHGYWVFAFDTVILYLSR